MSVYQLKTFADLVAAVREELQIASTDTNGIIRIKRDLNTVYMEVVSRKAWWWLQTSKDITFPAYVNAGSASVTQGSNVVTLSIAPASSKADYYFATDGYLEVYKVESHVAGSTTVKLANEFTGATSATANYKIFTN